MTSKKKLKENMIVIEKDEATERNVAGEIPVSLTHEDSTRLLQELQLKEIELELKFEEMAKLKNELENQSARNLAFFMNSPDPVLILDKRGLIKDINLSGVSLLKVQEETIKEKSIRELIAGAEPEIPEELSQFENNRTGFKLHLAVPGTNPVYCYAGLKQLTDSDFSLTLHPIHSIAGSDISGNNTELTQRTEAQQKETENNFNYAERIAHMGSFQHNLISGECHWSDELYRICGFEPGSFVPSRGKFLSVFHPDDRPAVEQSINNAILDKTGYRHESRIVRSDGEIKYVISVGHLILDSRNEPVEIKGAIMDITEMKKIQLSLRDSENRYKILFESMPVGLAITDANGKIRYGNRKSRILLGISRSEVQQGSILVSRWKFIYKDGTPIPPQKMPHQLVISEKRMQENIEVGIQHENGEITWLNVTAAPMENPGEVLYAFIDITGQTEREIQLEQLSQKLKELVATKDKFFSIIAHDLKNPFNSILGFSELMLKNLHKYNREDIERFLGIINSTSQNAYNLLENLLNWSRTQSGNIEFTPCFFDLAEIIQSNLEFVENYALKKNIRIYFEPDGKYLVHIDKNMIDTVLRNLLSNSVKFSYPGGKIVISIEPEDDFYKVRITDNGIGIEEENIDKLFRIDSKYSSFGTNQEKGSGLGLIISKEFIEKHHGKIWATSEFGKGSEFVFTLPKN